MNKKVVIFSLALLLFTSLVFSAPKIWLAVDEHDFGLVMEGEQASFDFQFENTGDDTLKLSNVKPSCGCTSPFWTKDPIAPGESGTIKVTYNSKGRPGEFVKTITITSNAEETSYLLRIKGVVYQSAMDETQMADAPLTSPALVLSKLSHSFGKVELNKEVSYKFKYTNEGTDVLKIESVKAGCHCVQYRTDKESLEPGESATLEIKYTPRNEGSQTDRVVIFSNDHKTPALEITLKANVMKSLVAPSIMQQNTGFGF